MNRMGVLRRDTRVDQRIKTGEADLATAFHAPKGGSTAQRCEDRGERIAGLHIAGCKGVTRCLKFNVGE